MKSLQLTTMAIALMLAGTVFAGRACAGFGSVPEIDPNSLVSSLALLAGGVLVITDRCRARR